MRNLEADYTETGSFEPIPSHNSPTTARSCYRCGWAGDDSEVRVIEHFTRSTPSFWSLWPACPRCGARIERR